MIPAPLPADEAGRLAALRDADLLDTLPELDYDDLTRLASTIAGTPIALVSLIDSDRQWFKSKVGLDASETPRDLAFCGHAILGDDLFTVPDSTVDDRFHDNPLVTGAPHVRFYAGMPLETAGGHNVGTLCVLDHVPRTLTPAQEDALRVLGRQVATHIELRRSMKALRLSEAKFRNTVDHLAEGVFLVDVATRTVIDANAAVLKLLARTTVDFVGQPATAFVAQEGESMVSRTVAQMDERLARDGRCDLGRRRLLRKDGKPVTADVRVTAVPGGLHAVIVRDVTEEIRNEERLFAYQCELEEANARLKALATTDKLTGIANRAAFDGRLAEEFDRSRRYGSAVSVILIDVDHFKLFNDAFGHPAGDAVLRQVAGLLRATARKTDFVARYGGEEFVIVLPETEEGGAMVVAERCRRAIAAGDWDHRAITISVGVATRSEETGDSATLVQEADLALYQSKRAGRNRVTHHAAEAIAAG